MFSILLSSPNFPVELESATYVHVPWKMFWLILKLVGVAKANLLADQLTNVQVHTVFSLQELFVMSCHAHKLFFYVTFL